jgi:hypothetical protein
MQVPEIPNSPLHVLPDIFDTVPINELVREELRFPWGEAATIEINQLSYNEGYASCEVWIASTRRKLRVTATAVHFRDGTARTFSFTEFFDGKGTGKGGYYFSPASIRHPHEKGFTDLKGRYYKFSEE